MEIRGTLPRRLTMVESERDVCAHASDNSTTMKVCGRELILAAPRVARRRVRATVINETREGQSIVGENIARQNHGKENLRHHQ